MASISINSVIGSFALSDVIDPQLSDEALDSIALLPEFNGKAIDEILTLSLPEIETALGNVQGVVRKNRAKIANEFLDFLRRYVVVAPTAAAAPAPVVFPTSLKLEVDKRPEDMGTAELLSLLAAEPARFEEIFALLQRKPDFVRASTKAEKRIAIRINNALAVTETVELIQYLSKEGTGMVELFKNQHYPISLKQALGIDTRWFKDPFTGEAFTGLWNGLYDLSGLGDAYEAIIWYGETQTDGRMALTAISILERPTLIAALLREEVPPILDPVIRLFRSAKTAGEKDANNVSRFTEGPTVKKSEGGSLADQAFEQFVAGIGDESVAAAMRLLSVKERLTLMTGIMGAVITFGEGISPEQMLEAIPESIQMRLGQLLEGVDESSTPQQGTETYYKQLLEESAGKVWSPNNFGQQPRHKVVMGVQVSCFSCNLNGVVSLGPVVLRSYSTRGTVYVLRGTDFQDLSYSNENVNVVEKGSYKELAHIAGLV